MIPYENTVQINAKFVYEDGSNSPTGIILDNSEMLLVHNAQGDVTAVVNGETGETMVEYEYDPWGNVTIKNADGVITDEFMQTVMGALCPVTYRGYNYDFTTGLYYLQSRYYNPEWGRFLNVDDTTILVSSVGDPLAANMYAYCKNNPVNNVDYSGHRQTFNEGQSFAEWIGNLIGTVLTLGPFIADETYKKYFEFEKRDDICQVAIRTDKVNFLNAILCCASINKELTYQFLALSIDARIQEKMGRHFLFSDDCMADEIKWHVEKYYVAKEIPIDYNVPVTDLNLGTSILFISTWYIKKHCDVVNISESDVYDFKQANTFHYADGIRECYYGTIADPFVKTNGVRKNSGTAPENNTYWTYYLKRYGCD